MQTLSALAVAGVVAAGLVVAASPAAHAAPILFDFSFTGTAQNSGTITGQIYGLDDSISGPQSASGVFVDTTSIGAVTITIPPPYNFVPTALVNSFTVANGDIVAADFVAQVTNSIGTVLFTLDNQGANTFYDSALVGQQSVENQGGLAGVSYVDPPVPEPASIAMFGVGLLGLGMLLRRRAL